MKTSSASAVLDFEVYILMTMKRRLSMGRYDSLLEAEIGPHRTIFERSGTYSPANSRSPHR
jgi:hypothetical protein